MRPTPLYLSIRNTFCISYTSHPILSCPAVGITLCHHPLSEMVRFTPYPFFFLPSFSKWSDPSNFRTSCVLVAPHDTFSSTLHGAFCTSIFFYFIQAILAVYESKHLHLRHVTHPKNQKLQRQIGSLKQTQMQHSFLLFSTNRAPPNLWNM